MTSTYMCLYQCVRLRSSKMFVSVRWSSLLKMDSYHKKIKKTIRRELFLFTPFCSVPLLTPYFKRPGFLIPSELSDQSHMLVSSSFVMRRTTSVFLSTTSPRCQTSLVSRHVTHCLYTSVLSTPSPRPRRTFPHRRYVVPFETSWFPSTSKFKLLLPTIRVTSRTLSVIPVIGFQHLPHSTKCSQDCLNLENQFVSQSQTCIHFRERIFTFIRGRFYRHRIW